MVEIGAEECVGDLAAAHQVEHLCILRDFVLFEFIYGELALVNIDEVNQLFVVLNVLTGLVDAQLQRLYTLFYTNLGLKK
jgi:hypothetical protein